MSMGVSNTGGLQWLSAAELAALMKRGSLATNGSTSQGQLGYFADGYNNPMQHDLHENLLLLND